MMREPVELSPFHRADLSLAGFLLHHRWPDNLREWNQLLVLAVRMAAVPGIVPRSEVFASKDEAPEVPSGDVVGIVACAGNAIGPDAPAPGSLRATHAVMVLHPPDETVPTMPADDDVASGCLFLPGIPELGLDHRATWVEADREGNVGRLVSRGPVDPWADPDLAVLATLLAA
jgi:hypothetical protein